MKCFAVSQFLETGLHRDGSLMLIDRTDTNIHLISQEKQRETPSNALSEDMYWMHNIAC